MNMRGLSTMMPMTKTIQRYARMCKRHSTPLVLLYISMIVALKYLKMIFGFVCIKNTAKLDAATQLTIWFFSFTFEKYRSSAND